MLVTILNQKYKVGCEKGMIAEERPGIFNKLNRIIEWNKCTWPEKDGVPYTGYLGDLPELKSGDCFLYDGNVIALDRTDRLVLVLSETGIGALGRICDEIIDMEFSLLDCCGISSITTEKANQIPESFEEYKVPFYQMRLFHEKYSFGRIEPGTILKCLVEYFIPIEVYINDWSFFFNPEEVEKDEAKYLTKEILAWFYNNYERNLPPKEERPENVEPETILAPIDPTEDKSAEKRTKVEEVIASIKESVASGIRYSDELDDIDSYSGVIYYQVQHCEATGPDENGTTILELSNEPDFLPDNWDTFAPLAKKFEEDFLEYRVEEEMEAIFSVYYTGTLNTAVLDELKEKLKNNSNYKEGSWSQD